MVTCSKCRSECRHWVTRNKDMKGRPIGSAVKHVNCLECKEHWVYELPPPGQGFRLVARLIDQVEMF